MHSAPIFGFDDEMQRDMARPSWPRASANLADAWRGLQGALVFFIQGALDGSTLQRGGLSFLSFFRIGIK